MDVTKTYITALSQRSSTDDWWRDSAVLPVSSTPPVLVWVNDRPEVITPHLDHFRNLKITVVMRRSTADAVAWIGSNPGQFSCLFITFSRIEQHRSADPKIDEGKSHTFRLQ